MIEKLTLLQQAKKIKTAKNTKYKFNDEEYELALAWAKGEVTTRQMFKALGYKGEASVNTMLAKAFKRYYVETQIKP